MTMIAAYAFDEGAGASAAEINGGTPLAGVPGWAAGRHGSSMRLNGSSSAPVTLLDAADPFTIMFDIYLDGAGSGGFNVILNDWDQGSVIGNVQVSNSTGELEWYKGPGSPGAVIPLGEWHNVALVATGAQRRILLDGVLVGSQGNSALSGAGGFVFGGFPGYQPNMRVDNVRIYDEALTDLAIADLAGDEVGSTVPPPNQLPTANAGPNASAYVGQQVTLTGSGADSDGTIASYAWSQTSGPAVALSGAGATRTFTPTSTGSYVFTLVTTDDDGAQSIPDSVTITILAVPEEPAPAGPGLTPFGMIEKALVALLESGFGAPEGSVGGDLSYDATVDDYYIWLGLVTGSTTAIDGEWTIDIDVFDSRYGQAMEKALAIEAFLLKPGGHRTAVMRLDRVSQNEVPIERPWGDDNAFRVGATYTFTARRSG